MANLGFQVTGNGFQGVGQFAFQGSVDGGTPTPEVISYGANLRWDKVGPPKRKRRTIRLSDFAHQEEYAEALAQALAASAIPISKLPEIFDFTAEQDEDDEILVQALTITLLQ